MARTGQKSLNLVQQRVAIRDEVVVIEARKLDELCARNMLHHVPRIGNVNHTFRRTVENNGWNLNGR